MSKEEYKGAIEVSIIFHEGQRMFAVPKQPAQQEPVAIALNTGTKQGVKWLKNVEHGESLYTASQPAQQEPVLQDIEQYRLQMAGISTAAIGYWKESDGIHPDYDTIALRDVAKLYAKYDELYRAQRTWVGLEKSDMPDGADPLFDDPKFIAGMVYAANKLMEKNT